MNTYFDTLIYFTRTLAAARVQTTRYFSPVTVQMLRDRLLAKQAGLQSDDNLEQMDKFVARVAAGGH